MTGIGSGIAGKALTALAFVTSGLSARAQDLPPFQINPERVHYMSTQRCAGARTYIVPSLYLNILARSRTAKEGRSSRRIFVRGLDKAELQALSRALYDDLVARLRAAGATVLTYDDIKPDLAQLPRKRADERLGVPIRSGRADLLDFAIAAPSDEQAIDWDRKGVTWPYRALAESRIASVIVPEISFTLPQWGIKPAKNGRDGIKISPALMFSSGMMNGMPQDLRWCNIHVQEHTFRLATPVAGTAALVTQADPRRGSWSARRGDYDFVVDRHALHDGVLRVGQAFNNLMAEALKGQMVASHSE